MHQARIVIVGAGFAGYHAARTMSRIARGAADITLINPNDYFLCLPLLPQVATGILEPRRVSVSLTATLPGVRLILGEVDQVDLDARHVHFTDPEGDRCQTGYDRLVLAVGSVNKLLPIPGVAEQAHGFRCMPEALYLRAHITRQIELAATTHEKRVRQARRTLVVVGAGYTGTEVAAHGQLFTDALTRRAEQLAGQERPRWLLLDVAPRILPELDPRLSQAAHRVLAKRGVEVRTNTSVREATAQGVLLSDGERVGTRSLIWCVGVRPDPLVDSTALETRQGRLVVDEYLAVPGHPEVFAAGDAAAVPDLTRPGKITPMTAQHAGRQGTTAARNVAASLGHGDRRAYWHRSLGFAVDLGGAQAAANPLQVPLSGRIRVGTDWLLDAILPRQTVQLGTVRSWAVPLESASPEATWSSGPRPG